MYMCSKGLLPFSISSKFLLNSNVYAYNTRRANDYHLCHVRTNISKNTVFYKGPLIWTEIPFDLKMKPSLNSFKRNYKFLLLNSYSHSE